MFAPNWVFSGQTIKRYIVQINVKTYQFKTYCKDDVMISLH